MFDVPTLTGVRPGAERVEWQIVRADQAMLSAYRQIRREVFVREQNIFDGSDHDDVDDDPRTIVLVAVASDGEVLGGVRLAPAERGRDIGWWTGSRLVVRRDARRAGRIGPALVREACATAVASGVLRFEATVQMPNVPLFRRLGWLRWGEATVEGVEHARMRWPIDRIENLITATKRPLGEVLDGSRLDDPNALGGGAFIGDDGAPVPATDVVAVCDAILPSMVERDPEWAGWCGVLVNANDLSAMGARPSGLLDAVGAPTASFARRVLGGVRSASLAWGIPILGGHTQLGVTPSLAVTALGRTAAPVAGGGGRAGDPLRLTVDVTGRWRRGYEGRQWDSTSTRPASELRHLADLVRQTHPAAAKDVGMAGIVGTAALLAEASGTGATIDVANIPAPDAVAFGDWLTCFPGFGMLTADRPGASPIASPLAETADIGALCTGHGVRLRWPDGVETPVGGESPTGLGATVERSPAGMTSPSE